MTMVTRCPACSTMFKITPEQLRARGGQVRCGRCRQVFNALDMLAILPEPSPAVPPDSSMEQAAPPPNPPQEAQPPAAAPVPPAEQGAENVQRAEAAEPLKLDEERKTPPPVKDRRRDEETLSAGGLLEEPRSPRRRASLGWGIGAAVLLLTLAGQLAFLFRTELAALYPDARPYLEQACAHLGCEVPLPRKPQFIHIELSDLQADPVRPERLTLTMALRNRAPFRQAFPAIELTLTDDQNQPLARRVFLPQDYMIDSDAVARGLASNAVADIRLPLETGDLRPNGYRLYAFYP